jgi:hypothetical protein
MCPICGARTQVNETRGPFRDRHCTNSVCGLDFTTREEVMTQRGLGRLCARTRHTAVVRPVAPKRPVGRPPRSRTAFANSAIARASAPPQPERQAEAGA